MQKTHKKKSPEAVKEKQGRDPVKLGGLKGSWESGFLPQRDLYVMQALTLFAQTGVFLLPRIGKVFIPLEISHKQCDNNTEM